MNFTPVIEGLVLQASLILALGAQNLFVLENGLRRRHLALAAFVSTMGDLVLISIGVLGAGALFLRFPVAKIFVGAVGVVFLFRYAWGKVREASAPIVVAAGREKSRREIILAALGFSFLNPHVYLDTFVLLGGYSARFPDFSGRIGFGLGAVVVSAVWFFALSFGAGAVGRRFAGPVFARRVAWGSAVVLAAIGIALAVQVAKWCQSP